MHRKPHHALLAPLLAVMIASCAAVAVNPATEEAAVRARSGELATEVGTYTMRFDTPQGRVNDAGGYVTVWQKVDGNWVVATDIVTSAQPLPQR